ncbi:hypothetical protein MHYP_G00086310 [Metynnis hypsauchen]
MVAAFRHTTPEGEETTSEDSEDPPLKEDDSDPETDDDLRYHVDMDMERTPCVVHTLQLVIHMIQKESSVKRVLDKASCCAVLVCSMFGFVPKSLPPIQLQSSILSPIG